MKAPERFLWLERFLWDDDPAFELWRSVAGLAFCVVALAVVVWGAFR